uniref:Uncharacterized protein n=1 Tax=Rhizophora mucronata TaxID=61149 RepID=A0A2P2NJ45_RHIMU
MRNCGHDERRGMSNGKGNLLQRCGLRVYPTISIIPCSSSY